MITNKCIGRKLRKLRTEQRLTLDQLADKISANTGIVYSAATIGSYERDARKIPAEFVHYAAYALGTSEESFFQCDKHSDLSDRLIRQISALSEHEKQILLYLAKDWNGDHHTLIEFVGLYASLPSNVREEIAYTGIRLYKESKHKEINCNLQQIESGWRKLYNAEAEIDEAR